MREFEVNTRTEGPDNLYAVVAEWSNQGPILMETEGFGSSYDAAQDRARGLRGQSGFLRAAVVRLVYSTGNALVLHDMSRLQKENCK